MVFYRRPIEFKTLEILRNGKRNFFALDKDTFSMKMQNGNTNDHRQPLKNTVCHRRCYKTVHREQIEEKNVDATPF